MVVAEDEPYASTRRNEVPQRSEWCQFKSDQFSVHYKVQHGGLFCSVYSVPRCAGVLAAHALPAEDDVYLPQKKCESRTAESQVSEDKEPESLSQKFYDLSLPTDCRTEEEDSRLGSAEPRDDTDIQIVIDVSADGTLPSTNEVLSKKSELVVTSSSALNAIDDPHSQSLFSENPLVLQIPSTDAAADSKGNVEKLVSTQISDNLPILQSKCGNIFAEVSSPKVQLKEHSDVLRNAITLSPESQVVRHAAVNATGSGAAGETTNSGSSCKVTRSSPARNVTGSSHGVLLLLCLLLLFSYVSSESLRDRRGINVELPSSVNGINYSRKVLSTAAPAAPSPAGALRVLRADITFVAYPGISQTYKVPVDTYNRPLGNLNITVTQWNGSALPRWIYYWPSIHTFDIAASQNDLGTHEFVLHASDSNGTKVVLVCVRVVVMLENEREELDSAAGASRAACRLPPRASVNRLELSVERGKSLLSDVLDHLDSLGIITEKGELYRSSHSTPATVELGTNIAKFAVVAWVIIAIVMLFCKTRCFKTCRYPPRPATI